MPKRWRGIIHQTGSALDYPAGTTGWAKTSVPAERCVAALQSTLVMRTSATGAGLQEQKWMRYRFETTGVSKARRLRDWHRLRWLWERTARKDLFHGHDPALWDIAYRETVPDFKEEPYDLGSFAEIAHHRGGRGGRADNLRRGSALGGPKDARAAASRSTSSSRTRPRCRCR